jgi:hypothetical protein
MKLGFLSETDLFHPKRIPNKNEHVRTKMEASKRSASPSLRHKLCSGVHFVQNFVLS